MCPALYLYWLSSSAYPLPLLVLLFVTAIHRASSTTMSSSTLMLSATGSCDPSCGSSCPKAHPAHQICPSRL
ncbi:hypothetical protein AcV5_004520 [Taiwanofungus camphoratus]|nr:hypothetical protein AcV5_004520 [Antrodia cinnamomea]